MHYYKINDFNICNVFLFIILIIFLQSLPFMEYELHNQLLNKLKVIYGFICLFVCVLRPFNSKVI